MLKEELMRERVSAWRQAGPELERMRAEKIRAANTRAAIELLSDAFASAVRQGAARRRSSGLVIQQRLFQGLRT